MKKLIVLALLASCVSSSRVGPYVKNVVRQGDWLIVQKCVIELEGEELHEVSCTAEQLPLRSIPMAPPMQPMPPAAPPR
jgi:hypothetical protein